MINVITMKHYWKFLPFVAMVLIGINVYVLNARKASVETDWILENIDALAMTEGESEGRLICYSVIKDEGYGSFTVTKCSSCMDVRCTDYSTSSKCKK